MICKNVNLIYISRWKNIQEEKTKLILNHIEIIIFHTALKVLVFGVILVRIFPHPYSVPMRENADQNNSECGQFLRSVIVKCLIGLEFGIRSFRLVEEYVIQIYISLTTLLNCKIR